MLLGCLASLCFVPYACATGGPLRASSLRESLDRNNAKPKFPRAMHGATPCCAFQVCLRLCAHVVQGASASVYALLACNAVVDPYRRFVWLFGLQLNSLGCVLASPQQIFFGHGKQRE